VPRERFLLACLRGIPSSPPPSPTLAHAGAFLLCSSRDWQRQWRSRDAGQGVRLQELVPIPLGNSLSELSEQLLGRLKCRAQTTRDAEGQPIAERFEAERGRMLALPSTDFPAAVLHSPMLMRRALVQIEGAYYSVWSS